MIISIQHDKAHSETPRATTTGRALKKYLPSRRPRTGSSLKPLRFNEPTNNITQHAMSSDRQVRADKPWRVRSIVIKTKRKERGARGCADAEADMPSAKPWAQGAFKTSMVHGILQFTLRIAFRCVLHRSESQDIRC